MQMTLLLFTGKKKEDDITAIVIQVGKTCTVGPASYEGKQLEHKSPNPRWIITPNHDHCSSLHCITFWLIDSFESIFRNKDYNHVLQP